MNPTLAKQIVNAHPISPGSRVLVEGKAILAAVLEAEPTAFVWAFGTPPHQNPRVNSCALRCRDHRTLTVGVLFERIIVPDGNETQLRPLLAPGGILQLGCLDKGIDKRGRIFKAGDRVHRGRDHGTILTIIPKDDGALSLKIKLDSLFRDPQIREWDAQHVEHTT